MTEPLLSYKKGKLVIMLCQHKGCERTRMAVILRGQFSVHPDYHGNGRFILRRGMLVKGFHLSERPKCPNCHRMFAEAIILHQGHGKKPVIFGEESE